MWIDSTFTFTLNTTSQIGLGSVPKGSLFTRLDGAQGWSWRHALINVSNNPSELAREVSAQAN